MALFIIYSMNMLGQRITLSACIREASGYIATYDHSEEHSHSTVHWPCRSLYWVVVVWGSILDCICRTLWTDRLYQSHCDSHCQVQQEEYRSWQLNRGFQLIFKVNSQFLACITTAHAVNYTEAHNTMKSSLIKCNTAWSTWPETN